MSKNKKELEEQIKALKYYIESLKKIYGAAYNEDTVYVISDEKKADKLREQIDHMNAENDMLIKQYHNMMKDADCDIDE